MNYFDLSMQAGLRMAAILLVLLASPGRAQLGATADLSTAEKSGVKLEDTAVRPFHVQIPEVDKGVRCLGTAGAVAAEVRAAFRSLR